MGIGAVWHGSRRRLTDGPSPATELITRRLVLRLPERADIGAIARLVNDWEVAKQTIAIPYPYRRSDARRWVNDCRRYWTGGREYAFALWLQEDRQLIGAVSLARLRAGTTTADRMEIGYWIGRRYWGAGYAGEAVDASLKFARRELAADAA